MSTSTIRNPTSKNIRFGENCQFINKSIDSNKVQINFRLWVEVVDKVGVEVMGQGRAGKTGQLG